MGSIEHKHGLPTNKGGEKKVMKKKPSSMEHSYLSDVHFEQGIGNV